MNGFGVQRLAGAALVAVCLGWDAPAQEPTSDRDARPDTTLIQDLTRPGQPVRVSTRWIGVVCSPVDDLLRAHVNLPEGAGLVVHSTVPGSPGEQAGLQQHDILVSVQGAPLTGLEQLVEAIEASDGNAMEFTWLRKGASITKPITPEMRPTEMKWSPGEEGAGWTPNVDTDALQKWVEKLRTDPSGNEPFEMRFFGPGITPGVAAPEFSGVLSVQVAKESDEPARITVRRDDETWEVTEDTLDQLPEDLQGHVERMLGKGGMTGIFRFRSNALPKQLQDLQQLKKLQVPNIDLPVDLQQRFDEMQRRMEEMRRQIQEIRETPPSANDDGVDA